MQKVLQNFPSFKHNLLQCDLNTFTEDLLHNYILLFGNMKFYSNFLNKRFMALTPLNFDPDTKVQNNLTKCKLEEAFRVFFEAIIICFSNLKDLGQVFQFHVLKNIEIKLYLSHYFGYSFDCSIT